MLCQPSPKPNLRYSDIGNNIKVSSTKIGSKGDSLINYELLGISHSKNFMEDRRKRGKSHFYKKISDIGNNSEIFFAQNKVAQSNEVSKGSSPSE